MKFLDKKEQVLEIKMTAYGKSKLSRGVFNPTYYAFYDNDIIYDSQYNSNGSSTALEPSTQASDRIRNSIRPETQYNYAGVESSINHLSSISEKLIKLYLFGEENSDVHIFTQVDLPELTLEQKLEVLSKPSSPIDNYYSMGLPLGTSEYNSDKIPAWDLKLIRGQITGSVLDYTGSSGLIKIPQINVDANYNIDIKYQELNNGENNETQKIEKDTTSTTIFPDGSVIEIDKDYVLVDLAEHNSLFEKENFDVEVYKIIVEPDSVSGFPVETLQPLYFINGEKISDTLYYSKALDKTTEASDGNVEFYFDVSMDDEIVELSSTDYLINPAGFVDGSTGVTDLYDKVPENDEEPC